MPSPRGDDERVVIVRLLKARRVAVVGLSDDPMRPSRGVAEYLLYAGYDIVPVNPNYWEVLGRRAYAALADVPGPIDLVLVFRRPEHCADVAREAVSAGAKGIWLQSGIYSTEARQIAAAAGIDYVEGRCMMVEHRRGG